MSEPIYPAIAEFIRAEVARQLAAQPRETGRTGISYEQVQALMRRNNEDLVRGLLNPASRGERKVCDPRKYTSDAAPAESGGARIDYTPNPALGGDCEPQ